MSTSGTPLLTTCGCCGGSGASAAAEQQNPPGLSALAYRVGTHGSFVAGMLDSISGTAGLSGLTVRDTQDPAIALMDAWAVVLDVLTFYQERIVNEGYLRTATERVSVLQLAAEIAYQLNPGVAAETQLAFLMDNLPGSPSSVLLGSGTKVQSIPAQNQSAQVFETVVPLTAMLDWNVFGAKTTLAPVSIAAGQSTLYVNGIATNLQKGDALLLIGDERRIDPSSTVWNLRQVAAIALDTTRNVTVITLDQPLDSAPANPCLYAMRQRAGLFGANAPDWRLLPLSVQLPYMGFTAGATNNWTTVPAGAVVPSDWPGLTLDMLSDAPPPGATGTGVTNETFSDSSFTNLIARVVDPWLYWYLAETGPVSLRLAGWVLSAQAGAYIFNLYVGLGLSATAFLNGSPLVVDANGNCTITLSANTYYAVRVDTVCQGPGVVPGELVGVVLSWTEPNTPAQWVPTTSLFPLDVYTVHLDAAYPKIVAAGTADSWVAFSASGRRQIYQVTEAVESSRTNFTLNGKTTRLRLSGPDLLDDFGDLVRETLVLGQSEQLFLAEAPDTSNVEGTSITIDQADIAPLPVGRVLLVTGNSSVDGTPAAEIVQLDSTGADPDGNVVLNLHSALMNSYVRTTVQIYGNVAEATNGETKSEILGSGDGTVPNQSFTLRQNPLTYTQAATASGSASTLQVTVNGLLWTETPSFYGAGPSDRVFTSRIGDDGTVSVNFGDGVAGSRLPTGTANVSATYRVGTGLAGMLAPSQISMLLTRPLGLKSVTNPLAPTGAADPEGRDDARVNAPLTVLTLDRIVSLDDYENFARAFSGIGKARADWFWEGESTPVYVTVAPSSGVPAAAGADPYANLRAAIDAARDPAASVRVGSYSPVTFGISATVLVDKPTYAAADVLAAVTAALTAAFSFASRDFAQPVYSSEVSAIIQAVPGVIANQVTALYTANSLFGSLSGIKPVSSPVRDTSNPFASPGMMARVVGPTLSQALAAASAYAERQTDGTYIEHPAELLTLDPILLNITEMTQI